MTASRAKFDEELAMRRANPIETWGRDHWSQLLYVESVVVDGNGRFDHRKMRDKRRGPETGPMAWSPRYGTRMRDGSVLPDHDDFDVMADLRAEGMVIPHVPGATVRRRVRMTEWGFLVAGALRAHKAAGGSTKDFVPPKREEQGTD